MRQIYTLAITAALFLAAGAGLGFVFNDRGAPTAEEAFAIVLAELDEAGVAVEDAGAVVDAAIAQ